MSTASQPYITLCTIWDCLTSLIFLLQLLNLYWACFCLKNSWESIINTGNSYHGVAKCTQRKFCSKFFAQISEHFCAYFRLHWPDHSNLGIIGKIFPSAELEYLVMPILVKVKVMTSELEHKANICHGRLPLAQASMG